MPSLPVLILSMHNERQIVQRALKAGAQGYVTKDSEPNVLLTGVRKVAEGGKFIDPALVESVVFTSVKPMPTPRPCCLRREYQILQMIVSGHAAGRYCRQLASQPQDCQHAQDAHDAEAGVTNNPDLVRCAIRHGMTRCDGVMARPVAPTLHWARASLSLCWSCKPTGAQ